MVNTTNPDHDKIWAIVRDAMNQAISINDAVARIKGLQDASELTEEKYQMADNVNPEKNDEKKDKATEIQEQSLQNELAFGNTADPGEGADADVNDIIGNDTGRDTDTLGTVPDDQVSTGKLKGDMVVADTEDKPEATEDGKRAKPADQSNEVAPAVDRNTSQENESSTLSKRQQKKQAAKGTAQENDKS